MDRSEIEREYQVDSQGIIRTPGKFEGSMVYAPYYHSLVMEGASDETLYPDDGEEGDSDVVYETDIFRITPDERVMFPELEGFTEVRVWEDGQGFVFAARRA